MMETTILLKPEPQWREKPRWYSALGARVAEGACCAPFWRDRITEDELIAEMNAALQLPGITNAWTMPIKGRLDMLSTGIRTPVGIKISGADLGVIEKIGLEVEAAVQKVPGHAQRLRRARRRRLLPRLRARSATSWPATASRSTTPT